MIAGDLMRSYWLSRRTAETCAKSKKRDTTLARLPDHVLVQDKTHSYCTPEMHLDGSVKALIENAETVVDLEWKSIESEAPYSRAELVTTLNWDAIHDRNLVVHKYQDGSIAVASTSDDQKLRPLATISINTRMYKWLDSLVCQNSQEKGHCDGR